MAPLFCCWNTTLLYLIAAVTLSSFAKNETNAAVLPRRAPLKVVATDGDGLSAPTPLPVVSTYSLYFGNGGAAVSAPVVLFSAASQMSSTPFLSAPPPRSTSKLGRCSKKHTSTHVSAATQPPSSLASSPIDVRKIASTSASVSSTSWFSTSQQNTIFPTVAPATSTSTAQRVSVEAGEVLPYSFINKVDALVETYHGITGRKARQVALILSNQTDVIANTSRISTILLNLAEAYPATNTTTGHVAARNATLFDWTTIANKTSGLAPKGDPKIDATTSLGENASALPHKFVIKAGRSNITLHSNAAGYGPDQVRHDLHVIRKWAGDLDQLNTTALLDETVAAIMSAADRYYPELSTLDAARVIMADIKAESDFDADNVSGPRLNSGSSWGLMQVSPFGSGEVELFQKHATVRHNTYSWSQTYNVTTTPSTFGAGPLLDWDTGNTLDLKTLTNDDLFRPWINIHIATWIQSNLARTSSQDPYSWTRIYDQSNDARNLGNDKPAWDDVDQALVGAGLPRTFLTALGSWVAGPAVDGYGSYSQLGDDVSEPYFNNIARGLSVLYETTIDPSWLDTLTLHAGLVDFH